MLVRAPIIHSLLPQHFPTPKSYNSSADATNTLNTETKTVKHKQMDTSELQAELEKLHGASFGWALSCCRRDRAEAEEVLQTVYLKILEGKARYRGKSNLKTWLFAVIRKTAITEQRKHLLRTLKSIAASKPRPERNSLVV